MQLWSILVTSSIAALLALLAFRSKKSICALSILGLALMGCCRTTAFFFSLIPLSSILLWPQNGKVVLMGALAISLLYCSFVLLSRYKEAQADWLSHRVLRIMVLWYFTVGVLYGLFLGIFPLSR